MQDIEDLKPREPGPSECCGSGCARCVWDVYFDEYSKWETRKASGTLPLAEDTPAPSAVFARSEPNPAGCSSYLGSVVLKYVDFEGEEDDFGVVCPSDSKTPQWRESIAGNTPLTIQLPTADATTTNDAPHHHNLELVALNTTLGNTVDISQYSPGDVLELYAPNHSSVVSSICKHFRLPETRLVQLKASPFVSADCFPPWIPQRRNITVKDLFTYYVDVSSSAYIRKPFLSLLQKCVAEQHAPQRSALQRLCDQHKELQAEVSTTFPSLLDMLDAFGPYLGASGIPLAKFLEVSAPLRSRKFSIVDVSSVSESPPSTSFLLCARRIVHERRSSSSASTLVLPASLERRFEGHVSQSLFSALRINEPSTLWLRRSSFGASLIPRNFVKRPLMMFCGGSGIGPALSVLVAAHKLKQDLSSPSSSSQTPIPRWLMFSSRSFEEAEHILGEKSLVSNAVRGTCSRITVNVTRPEDHEQRNLLTMNDTTIHLVPGRIDAVIRNEAQEIYGMFHDSKAAILACGPSGFLSSTREALSSILFPVSAEDDSSVSEQQWTMSELNGDIVFEDWNQRK
ncbi:oxidoreductase, putative [Bodo saltans]|uniref:Oxidoreductase, putative n=1 Tax=Bodo saltans TaxID=75058 RepID=A0A0S4INF0_BODSA|nr:oxidoreductase, putative [Bodo saltans]|eukprot:CUF65337.1 oxidoreductase, putative [Bodo saltans]